MAVALRTVFEDNTRHNPATMIFGFLDSTRPSEAAKIVQSANLKRMQQVGELINQTARSLTDRVQAQKSELFEDDPRPSREILNALSNAADDKLVAIDARLAPAPNGVMVELWGHARSFARAAQTPAAMDRMIVFFHKFNAHLDAWQAQYPDAPAAPDAVQITQSYQETNEMLKKFIVPERLTQRFQAVVHPQAGAGFNTADHTQMSRCLGALHESQRTSASLIEFEPRRESFSQFAQAHFQDFSLQRFLEAEEIIFQAQSEIDHDLNHLWDLIGSTVHLGPNLPQTAARRRTWMNDPQNAPALGTVAKLGLVGLRTIPPEIQRLTSLSWLSVLGTERGRLTTLPPELANLTQLKIVAFSNQNFAQVPEVLQRLPCICNVLVQNERPITAFPEILASQYSNGLWMHVLDALWNMFSGVLRITSINNIAPQGSFYRRWCEIVQDLAVEHPLSSWQYLGMRPETLTDIPFSAWFRDNFSIPYIPMWIPGGLWCVGCVSLAFLLDLTCCRSLTPLIIGNLVLVGIALLALVNLPIFLLNLTLHWAIEPIVELFRSCLGYSSMVHIEPEPQPAQAG